MYWLLNPRVIIGLVFVVVLGATHFTAYRSGRAVVRAAWEKEKAELTAKALDAERQNRAKEKQLLLQKQHAEAQYVDQKRKAATAALASQSALDSLRNELAQSTPTCPTPADPSAASRAAGAARLERELLGDCAKTLTDLAAEADRLEARIVGLQAYVKQVCLKQ